ncbi:MAG: bifunctional 4-hydroxy-2-oxoglutarate aldolase/2-dehydro-3-deoxy-phosphogluconate aldolase [Capsulimonadales bacterium]|nr:bifunctional 4-hydroxy-2-oxoglutarate aldolase/2-dehydro-3-deoxy-phosphogluconate aldolase [Capsulimonadales bacterium]
MNKTQILERMLHPGVIAVLRADSSAQLLDVAAALEAGGVTCMEVTMTTPNALKVIEQVAERMGSRVCIGVGTVLDAETARMALLSGAQYVVTPVMKPDIIHLCNRYSRPIVCGAYTPTEALSAHENGADFIKIFPADGLGPNYIKAIKAPLPQLEIIPTGGVDVHTAGDFIRAGCAAVAAGGSLVSKEVLKTSDWGKLTEVARAFVTAVAQARGQGK